MFQGKLTTIGASGRDRFLHGLWVATVLALVGIAGAAMAWLLFPAFAVAQEAGAAAVAADPGTTLNLGDLFGDVRSTIVTVVGVGVAAIVGWVAELVRRNTGISIDAKMRESLQSAVMNGVHFGLDAVQGVADKTSIDVRSRIVREGIDYVRSYAPKAAKHFKLTDADLEVMLRAKLGAVQAVDPKPEQLAGA